ncbi:MAG: nitroreductase family deazaflavin-dependent oxidoreductase [Polyangiaceae bacterium]|nr:nitroreductase family deazaflavin-dependent oxidoreductase [Polyangiaceae bacterium]MCB9607386.1 nitroreductase family deazaflavin-dependent oxidoreductase [Polyangiaceae bacterium]
MPGTVDKQPPSGLMRAFLRAPIWIYRANLGWLMGQRFLYLRHIGRKSGQERRAVVEVVNYDQSRDCWYVASGWGEGANWFRNVQAHPDVTITVGRRTVDVHGEVVEAEEAAQALLSYSQRYPTAYNKLSKMCTGAEQPATQAGAARFAARVPLVRFTPRAAN